MIDYLVRTLLRFAVMAAALGFVLLVARFPGPAALLLVVPACRRRPWRGSGSAFGTAAFAGLKELASLGLLGKAGLIVGKAGYTAAPTRWQAIRLLFANSLPPELAARLFFAAFNGARWGRDAIIRIKTQAHAAVFAPTGRGKGVSLVIPNLLTYAGSCCVTDIKGELANLTAWHRRTRFGHHVVILDPYQLTGPSDCLNPLDFIDATAVDFLDQCRDLANALILRKGTEHDPHWNDSAELILAAFIVFVCACEPDPNDRTLMTVRHLLASREKYQASIDAMRKTNAAGGVVKKLGDLCTWFIEKEGASVMTTLHRQTAWIDSPAIAATMGHSTFDPRGLKSGMMDIFMVLPPERQASMPAVMRMWLDTTLRAISREGAGERHKILFMLDEIGHLGHIQSVENAVTLMRGYGVRLFFFFQSIAQVKDCFGDRAGKFLDNIDTKIFFGLNAFESAEAVSKLMGDETIVTTSFNRTRTRSGPNRPTGTDNAGQWSDGTSFSYSEAGRPLMRPDEILRAPEDFGLVFHRNLPVIPVRLIRYFDDPDFAGGGMHLGRGLGFAGLAASLYALAIGLALPLAAAILFLPPRPPAPSPRMPATPSEGNSAAIAARIEPEPSAAERSIPQAQPKQPPPVRRRPLPSVPGRSPAYGMNGPPPVGPLLPRFRRR